MLWFFALDHYNYALWLSVHVRDMVSIHTKIPDLAQEFDKGMFVVYTLRRMFSAMAIDQAHKQNNASVKGDGGGGVAVGLRDNAHGLARWIIDGPEIARVVQEFESTFKYKESLTNNPCHHDQSSNVQYKFRNYVNDVKAC